MTVFYLPLNSSTEARVEHYRNPPEIGNSQPVVVWDDFNNKARLYGHTSTNNGFRKKAVEAPTLGAWRLQYLHTGGSIGTEHAYHRPTTPASPQTYLLADHGIYEDHKFDSIVRWAQMNQYSVSGECLRPNHHPSVASRDQII
ncbi:hypothetical protein SARC_04425 [Sphaeroforma arctica JP610]|uniref:Uncharacterized protein n=1 Tax=Sphaeroforma arctica JP610 TaxID=667725 RepID=A0A0L0G2M0_9EUKA|nr:hypothetical protein SARC_04425 [Sphaeroforma arctica JP610]KNC83330.1 hypothetical protein SARC_04425 [Sphaeroforma arctica JP610]|eukprot:XP_014157232.1 hypothetical protein SARC_04425 [Sphaeroforma arctica JP610]